jgi:O-antigen/teichoic acid export membrane protein
MTKRNKEGRTKKFIKNSTASAVFQIVNSLCGLITPRLMLLAYGSAINGLVSSITQFLHFFSVVEAGIAMSAQYTLYKPLEEKDNKTISSIVSAARIAYTQVGIIFSLLTIALSFLYPIITGVEDLSYGTTVALVIVLALNYLLSFFIVSKYQLLFQADQRVYVISIAKTVARVINTICIVLLASPNVPILLLRIIVSSSVIIQALIISIYARVHYKNIDYYAAPDKSALGQRWDALYMQILGAVTGAAPVMILTLVAPLEHVSVYTIYNMVFSALMGILGIFVNGINASFGSLLHAKNERYVQGVYAEFETIYYCAISTLYTVACILIVPFVRIYTRNVTDTNYLLPGLGILFSLNAFFYNLKTPQGMMVQAAGHFKQTRHQNTIQALILVVFGIVLGKMFGIYGVLSASIMSNLTRCVILFFYVPNKIIKDTPIKTIKRTLVSLINGIVLFILLTFVVNIFVIDNFTKWFVIAIPVFILVACSFAGINYIFERVAFTSVLKRVKHIFRR